MIYGHIPEWIVKENPAFARAVARYYSIEHGKRKPAAKGELAYLQTAEKIMNRGQPLSPPMLIRFLSARERVKERVSTTDEKYLSRLLGAVRLSREANPDDNPAPIEHLFEAYYFLRKRDGQGSPLPDKHEVKNTAAIIASFHQEGLTAKLPEYLWRNRGLTEKEFQRVERVRKYLIEDKDPDTEKPRDHNWPERLAAAGLSDLPQKRRNK